MSPPAARQRLLVLWDVDGTLIDNGGVSKEAYAAGFTALTGRPLEQPVLTEGRTDLAIMRSLLERHGVAATPELLARIPEVMPAALEGLLPRLRDRGRAQLGAAEAIAALGAEPGVVQSVLTGNIRANAYLKTAAFGLHTGLDFEVGGYGTDSEVRADLVAAARRRAGRRYGTAFEAGSTVLIGDTPRDVEAGRCSGTPVIGVATGVFAADELAAAGAGVVLPDLRDTVAFLRAVRAAWASGGRAGAS